MVGSAGKHSVCVCSIHQNLNAVNLENNYHELEIIDLIVCDRDDKDCMVPRLETNAQQYLEAETLKYDDDLIRRIQL